MPLVMQNPYANSAKTMELEILRQFFVDYLNRFEAFKLFFQITKPDYNIAGQTRNTNTIQMGQEQIHLEPLLLELGVANHTSIGGDFIIGYDFENMAQAGPCFHDQIGLSIFDTANHGYEAFFLAGHIRAIILNILDQQIRENREVDNHLFVELNELLKGPIAQTIVEKTNPVRASLTKGAVGIHGQIHRAAHLFNFVCTGLPVFYYASASGCFFYLEPFGGPPLGYFNKQDSFFKPYVPHSVKLHPGDYFILATDGCYDSICVDDAALPLGLPKQPIRHFLYPKNETMDVMHSFDANQVIAQDLASMEDPAVQSFCYVLEPLLERGLDAHTIVTASLDLLAKNPCFNEDDQSLIVVKVEA